MAVRLLLQDTLSISGKKSKGVEWELGEMRLKKAGSRPIWPSTFFGSGVGGAGGALDSVGWDLGVRRCSGTNRRTHCISPLPLPTKVQEDVDNTSGLVRAEDPYLFPGSA